MTFDSRASAKAWLAYNETSLRTGTWIDPRLQSIKISEVASKWLLSDPRKRDGSVARDKSILITHILPEIGNRAIGSITKSDVQTLVDNWSLTSAPSTAQRQYACLRSLFSFAESTELISHSPCQSIRLPEFFPRDSTILDNEQLEVLSKSMGEYGPMVYLAVMGLRWGEIAGLRVKSLNFLNETVAITSQRTRGLNGMMVEQAPKTRTSRRILSLPEWLMEMLKDSLLKRNVLDKPDALVFVSPSGEPLHYSNWRRRVWLKATTDVGLENLTFHDLKHTAATTLVEEGVDIKTAQQRLGHANPQTTLRIYAQVTSRTDKAAAKIVGDRLRPQSHNIWRDPQISSGPEI
ncbi:MAG: site-specific integrase [Acidimicrobiales bacterium]|nr:site-specific integrase [Acidimicrobiales bacterium]